MPQAGVLRQEYPPAGVRRQLSRGWASLGRLVLRQEYSPAGVLRQEYSVIFVIFVIFVIYVIFVRVAFFFISRR